jgi:molybdopterin synthase catalytic subunit
MRTVEFVHASKYLIQGPVPLPLPLPDLKDAGAIASFAGMIRADELGGKTVTEIQYSAYPAMADKVFDKISAYIYHAFPLMYLRILHSVGTVKAGESSLWVEVHARHRKAAFQALEETVEQIKAEAPVWKQEFYSDGSYIWVNSSLSGLNIS